jgi:hypothetical protein
MFNTVHTPAPGAMAILVVYLMCLCGVAVLLNKLNIIIKL